MIAFDHRGKRPAPVFLRFLAALMMAAGLVFGGLAAPALADAVVGGDAARATTQDESTPAPNQSSNQGNDQGSLRLAGSAAMPVAADSAADCTSDQQWNQETQTCDPRVDGDPCALDPTLPVCDNGGGDPGDHQCDSGQILVDGQCVPDTGGGNNGGGDTGGGNNGGGNNGGGNDCTGVDYNGADVPGCGTPPGGGGSNSGGGSSNGNHGHHHSNSSSPGTSTGSAEGTVPGGSSSTSAVTSCDPAICSSTGATSTTTSAPTPAAASQQAGNNTLGDTGAPVHSTGLLLLGLGLLGGGFLLVRRPRTAVASGGAHRRPRH